MHDVTIALLQQQYGDCVTLFLTSEQVSRVKFALCGKYRRMLEPQVTFERNFLENVSDEIH